MSPLDQEGRNFYLLTSERQVEVRLANDGLFGLLFLTAFYLFEVITIVRRCAEANSIDL